MGENERWPEPSGPLPNGLLPGAGHVMRALDTEQWMMAEERTAELIACIQPNQLSEERRNAVANYVQQLIMNCFPCQVCTFGSVPLKTYLPDGDIDLTAFSHDQNLKDTWANQVRDMLQNEEKNGNAEFHVKEVQYIQAEVKIIKCLVENIVVDISFNQVGGLCTLCFLDEVDNLINQNHLFKRSVILVKAWCYYESRILGAHHGLISTYALETLVLYIFHVFNNSFHGPLEVLYRFLEFFDKFDWDNFCVSLWGPVPINSLPDVTADPPRKDSGELLLSKLFLDACSSVYAVFPGGQEHNGQPFLSKHFNVIDPLRVNNNLGRSVSKGNFFRIRSAFAFGAKRLARLLDYPKENLISEVNKFFRNTWERHGSDHRPDAAGADLLQKRVSTPDVLYDSGNPNIVRGKNVTENSVFHEKEDNDICSLDVSSLPGRISSKMNPMTNELSAASHIQSLKSHNLNSLRVTQLMGRENVSERICLNDGIQKDLKADHFLNDTQGRFLFARTHSSPELTDGCVDLLSQSRSHRQVEATYAHGTKMDVNNGKTLGSESLRSNIKRSSAEDTSFVKNACSEEIPYTPEAQVLNQEKQDIMNTMASAALHSFDGQFHVPFNLNSAHIPFSIAPSFLASMGYPPRSLSGFLPSNVPLINPSITNVQFPHSLASQQFTQSSIAFGMNSLSEAFSERRNENFDSVVINSEEADNDLWQEQDVFSSTGRDPESGYLDMVKSDHKPPAHISGSRYVPPPRASSSASAMTVQQKHTREKHGSLRQNNGNFPMQDDRGSDHYAEERSTSSRSSSAAHTNSLRSRTSSESSWDGSSSKTPTSTKDKRGKKIVSVDLATSHLKGQIMCDHVLNQTEEDDLKYAELSNKGSEMADRNPRGESIASLQVPRQRIDGSEAAQTNGADSMIPLAPMLIDPGLSQRMNDNSGLVAFYPTGPPVPFLTMLPVYNCPSEKVTSDASGGHCGGDETLINSESMQNHNPIDLDNSEDLNLSSSLKENTSVKASETRTPDILNSDFASHWQNLQFGRFCQDPRPHGPLLYPSPVMVPPTYLHGRFPYGNAGRPVPTNANTFSHLMTSYGPRLVPVAPLPSVSGRPLNMYQQFMDDMPRYRSGTGTYLPNPKVSTRERHSTGTRRGTYNNDRNDNYGDREGNWNGSSKSRAGRIHSRNQNDRINSRTDHLAPVESQSDHSWNTYMHETTPSYQCQNGPLNSNSNIDGPHHVAYNMFPLIATDPNGVSSGPSGPPVVVLYPFDHNAAYGFHGEPLEFGSLGHVDLSGVDEQSHLNEGIISRAFEAPRHNGNSMHQSSPDQPSSPHHKRKI